MLALHNLGSRPGTAKIDLGGRICETPELVFGAAQHELRDSRRVFNLDPFGFAWFRGRSEM